MINLQVRFIAAHNSGVYILRVEPENLFTFDRIVLLYWALWTKKIWFQKYFTENVLKLLFKQAYYLRVLHSKVIFECNPYLFLRLKDFRSYSHPSGPEYVFTIFVIHKLFLLKIYSTFLCTQLHSPEKRKEKRF